VEKLSEVAAEFKENILRLIYPRRCIFCNQIINIEDKAYLCSECANSVDKISGNACEMCGRPIEYAGRCRQCNSVKHRYDAGFALYLYKDKVRLAIHRMKYGKKGGYCRFLGYSMAEYADKVNVPRVDYVCPVPIHWRREHNRGYNQSELLARSYADKRGQQLELLLKRVVYTKPQSALKRAERAKNIKNVFELRKGCPDLKGKSVLLIDDIFTTGSTVDECTRVLKKHGAKSVYVYCLSVSEYD
jgi:ComF family protein